MQKSKIFTVDKFLGLNEAADGMRELKFGEASRAVNFAITDGYNITVRPGISRSFYTSGAPCILWSGYIRDNRYMIVGARLGTVYTFTIMTRFDYGFQVVDTVEVEESPLDIDPACKVFTLFDDLFIYVGCVARQLSITEEAGEHAVTVQTPEPYVPLIITGANPMGGGTALENLNILSDYARIQFSANIIIGSDDEENPDGIGATVYKLPESTHAVISVSVDNEELDLAEAGTFNVNDHTFTFREAPIKGVNNVEFTIMVQTEELTSARRKFARMPYVEAYNGSTDSRLFFYGDGSNITYYTGVTEYGRGSAMYLPAMNEIAVDFSDSPITGMTRHYSKLLAFKPDGVAAISYEPLTLEDGSLIAGFNMKTIHKAAGCQAPGQIAICANNPRSIANGNLYEWRPNSVNYNDERNAKVISQPICKTLAAADPAKIVVCDDNAASTYYMFLNDEFGTILVNRYELGVWTMFRSGLAKNVKAAAAHGDTVAFLAQTGAGSGVHTNLYYFDPRWKYDSPIQPDEELRDPALRPETDAPAPVRARWDTGYMDFGADYLRKFTSNIYVSLLPESSSKLTVTAATDRQDGYAEKTVGTGLFDYAAIDYAHWTYNFSRAPKMRRLKLKVKKFVFYKLIFIVDEPGTTATVLGYDQEIRYGSNVK